MGESDTKADSDSSSVKPVNRERERRILEAASKLIIHYGYDKTTVADIAHEAGISKGAIYLHFDGKETLFERLLIYETERVTADLLARMEADPNSGTFLSLYRYALEAVFANPMMKALVSQNRRILGDYYKRMQREDNPMSIGAMKDFSMDFVRKFQALGLLRQDMPAEAIIYILSMVRYGWFMIDEVLPAEMIRPVDEIAPFLTSVLERGLVPSEGGDTETGRQMILQWLTMVRAVLNKEQ